MDERKDAMREEIPNKGGAFSIVLIPSKPGVHSVHSVHCLIELNAIKYIMFQSVFSYKFSQPFQMMMTLESERHGLENCLRKNTSFIQPLCNEGVSARSKCSLVALILRNDNIKECFHLRKQLPPTRYDPMISLYPRSQPFSFLYHAKK